jgi:hypothetical protein
MKRRKEGKGFGWPYQAASGKPKRRPDVIYSVAAPDSGVRVIGFIIPVSGFYPCAGMACLLWVSCRYVLQIFVSISFSILAVN